MSTATAIETVPAPELTPASPSDGRTYSLDDLLSHPDEVGYELVDGRLEELNMSFESNFVGSTIVRLLGSHCGSPPIAFVVQENGYACFPGKKNRMRRPDVSLVLAERMTPAHFREGYTSIRPDLAVEVISPKDLVVKLEDKLDDYRAVGIPLVWLVFPSIRRVRVLRPDGPPTELGPDDELTGEAILPGFRCRVADLFAGLPDVPAEAEG